MVLTLNRVEIFFNDKQKWCGEAGGGIASGWVISPAPPPFFGGSFD